MLLLLQAALAKLDLEATREAQWQQLWQSPRPLEALWEM